MHPDWIEHRRPGDGELLGWILPEGEGFVAVDLLGHRRTTTVDWVEAEDALEDLGLGFLADPFELRTDGDTWIPVRLVEVSVRGIRAKEEDWGDVTAPLRVHELPFPAPDDLRLRGASS